MTTTLDDLLRSLDAAATTLDPDLPSDSTAAAVAAGHLGAALRPLADRGVYSPRTLTARDRLCARIADASEILRDIASVIDTRLTRLASVTAAVAVIAARSFQWEVRATAIAVADSLEPLVEAVHIGPQPTAAARARSDLLSEIHSLQHIGAQHPPLRDGNAILDRAIPSPLARAAAQTGSNPAAALSETIAHLVHRIEAPTEPLTVPAVRHICLSAEAIAAAARPPGPLPTRLWPRDMTAEHAWHAIQTVLTRFVDLRSRREAPRSFYAHASAPLISALPNAAADGIADAAQRVPQLARGVHDAVGRWERHADVCVRVRTRAGAAFVTAGPPDFRPLRDATEDAQYLSVALADRIGHARPVQAGHMWGGHHGQAHTFAARDRNSVAQAGAFEAVAALGGRSAGPGRSV